MRLKHLENTLNLKYIAINCITTLLTEENWKEVVPKDKRK